MAEEVTPKGGRTGRLGAYGLVVGLLVAFGVVGGVASLELSSTPRFCGSCHIMQPYYQSWKTSTHNEVPCVDCHIPPGVTAEFRKKYEALSMVTRYFTGTYSTNPWTEIDDASCLRCHEKRLLLGKEVYRGILFDHAPHLTQMRREKKLRCTSCHSQIVQGSHIAVTSSTCVLCHFKDQPLNQGTSRCVLCHPVPGRVIERGNFRFDHGEVIRFAMSCEGCHAGSIHGDGSVPRERCVTCHNEPGRLSHLGEVELLHRKHVTEHKVDCLDCHLEIQHGLQRERETVAPECRACHEQGHSLQQQLYAGIGGRGVEPLPSTMYQAGIRCQGCHLDLPGRDGGMATKADEIACMACHGPEYRKMYFRAKAAVEARERALEGLIRQSEPLFRQSASPAFPAFQDALHNLRLVEKGRGIHNPAYSYRLLEQSWRSLNEARRGVNVPPLARPWPETPYESACFVCHPGVEGLAGRVFDRPFSHASHVRDGRLDCNLCHFAHEGRPEGTHLRFGPEGCSGCHHPAEKAKADCQSCHRDLFSGALATERGMFSHQFHVTEASLDCAECHKREGQVPFQRDRKVCADCHQ